MPPNDKLYHFWVTVPTGYMEVALDEMREVLTGVQIDRFEKGRVQTRIYCTYERSPLRLLQLRSVYAVYAILADMRGITVGKPGIERIAGQAAKVNMAAAQRLAQVCDPEVATNVFRLQATVQGNHRFGQAQVVQSVQKAIEQQTSLRAAPSEKGLLLQVQVRGRSAVLGLRLQPPAGASHHAVGYCLGRMVGLEPEDRVLWLRMDRGEVAELKRSFGVEVYAGIVPSGQSHQTDGGHWFCWNGLDLPILDEECSHIMASCMRGQEERLLLELARILPFGGIALVEVVGKEVLGALVAAGSALDIAAVLPVGSPGRQHYLYALERIVEEELIQLHTIS